MKTAILTDSGSAMTIQQAQEHGIFLLPLQVIDEEHSYQDGVDISTEELYEALRKQHTPKTSMPVGSVIEATPVSYTHLDVYKRQIRASQLPFWYSAFLMTAI